MHGPWLRLLVTWALFALPAFAYIVGIEDSEGLRQTCSGMFAGKDTSIDVVFYPKSQGRATALVYELNELSHIGKFDQVRQQYGQIFKTYVCSTQAVEHGLCTEKDLGNFIVDDSRGKTYTVQQKQFDFGAGSTTTNVFSYNVTVTGYYCAVATSLSPAADPAQTNQRLNQFSGHVDFHNVFRGNLPAAEHPKLMFYGLMTLLYVILGAVWLTFCGIHREQIVTVQHFISATIIFLVIEMACQWLYYAYYNNHAIDFARFRAVDGSSSVTTTARFLLVLTNVLSAMRDSLSFFLLLIVSMGYGVVRPTIGSVLRKVQILTALHFIFGVMYSIGIILILLEMNGSWIFLFIFPLAATLTTFLMWILHSLKSTIQYLTNRRQTYKRGMFQRLYYILIGAVVAIMGFFFFSSFLVASNGTSELATTSWQYRWFLLDGSLSILYFVVFTSIAYVWRPTGQNMRLATSDELATDEEADVGDYEVHTLGGDDELDDDAVEVGSQHLKDLSHIHETDQHEGLPPYSGGPSRASSMHKAKGNDDELVFDAEDAEYAPPMRPSYDAGGNEVERERLQLSDDEDDARKKD